MSNLGRYNPNEGARSLDECLLCPEGKYCEEYGSSTINDRVIIENLTDYDKK